MRFTDKLRHAANVIDRLQVTCIEYVMTSDAYGIGLTDFKRAFAGKRVKATNIDAGRQYQITFDGVTFFADEHIASLVTEEVTLPAGAA